MTALTQDLTLTGEIVTVDDPLLVGKAYHLQDEVIVVGGSVIENYTDVTTGNRWRVRRGQDHTAPATHSSGTALTLAREFESGGVGGAGVTVDNQSDPPAEVTELVVPGAVITGDSADLSGLLRLRLLGPFRVAYDTAGIDAPGFGVALADLAAGTWVISAWAVFFVNWELADSAIMQIWIGIPGAWENGDWVQLTKYDAEQSGLGGTTLTDIEIAPSPLVNDAPTPDNVDKYEGHVLAAAKLGVWVDVTNPGPLSQGEADIYALIAEPLA